MGHSAPDASLFAFTHFAMKTRYCLIRWSVLTWFFCYCLFPFHPLSAQSGEEALIIPVEAGIRQIRVEAYFSNQNRWVPVAIAHLDGQEGTVKVRIPEGISRESLRILASEETFFPESYTFRKETIQTTPPGFGERISSGGFWLDEPVPTEEPAEDTGQATVEESDIWRVSGHTLYYYNQTRGLQVFDLSDPGTPQMTGSFAYPGRGEQMYLLGADHVLLIGKSPALELLVISVATDTPEESVRLDGLPGLMVESRMVGSTLYYATMEYHHTNASPENILHVGAVDFSDPAAPVSLEPLSLPLGNIWQAVFTATPSHLMVSVERNTYTDSDGEWWQMGWRTYSQVFLIGLDSAGGHPSLIDSVEASGFVQDKHKLHFHDNVLTVVSQASGYAAASGWYQNTILETFVLVDGVLSKAGDIEVAPDETLFATLFDRNRVYAVTFLIVDPLYVFDTSNPHQPVILGELEVPGYSNVLRMIGEDRLFSVGVEDGRVAASLFDVGDPNNLSLLSRAYIGNPDESTWSEGQYDDRAVTLLSEEGLALLPFQSYGYPAQQKGIQVFTLDRDVIEARGRILHEGQARRATSLGDGILVSVSDSELFTIDLSDPDAPEVLADLLLSWRTRRVIHFDDYLVQIDIPDSWQRSSASAVITHHSAPHLPLGQFDFPQGKLVGLAARDDILQAMFMQRRHPPYDYHWGPAEIRLHSFDFSDPLNPQLMGESASVHYNNHNWSGLQMEASWLEDGSILWTAGTPGDEISAWDRPVMEAPIAVPFESVSGGDFIYFPYFVSNRIPFVSTRLDPDHQPVILDLLEWNDPQSTDGFVAHSPTFVQDQLAFFSTQEYWYDWHYNPGRNSGSYEYHLRQNLHVLDFSQKDELTILQSLSISGELQGVQQVGPEAWVLFTNETRWIPADSPWQPDALNRVRAYGYDGVQLLLLDEVDWAVPSGYDLSSSSLELSQLEYSLFRGTTPRSDQNAPLIERLTLSQNGQLQAAPSISLPGRHLYSTGHQQGILFAFTDTASAVWPFGANSEPEWYAPAYPPPYSYSSDRMVRLESGLYLANDVYGVLELPVMSPPFTPGEPEAEAPAEPIDDIHEVTEGIVFTALDAIDSVGRLIHQRWLFRPAAMRGPDPHATDGGDGWKQSSWFGWYLESEWGSWIYHLEHGWFYCAGHAGGTWLYDLALGWVWTGDLAYPWIFAPSRGSWLYYLEGSAHNGKPRWFYDAHPEVRDWISIGRP